MKLKESEIINLNLCQFLAEIEIKGQFVALYKLGNRTHFVVLENDGSVYKFKSRKAADEFISKI